MNCNNEWEKMYRALQDTFLLKGDNLTNEHYLPLYENEMWRKYSVIHLQGNSLQTNRVNSIRMRQ